MRWAGTQTGSKIENPCLLSSSEFGATNEISSLPSLVLIQNPVNNGFAAGNNVALRTLANEEGYIWLLNPDVVIQPTTMSSLVRFAENNPDNAIIGSVIRYQANPEKVYIYGGAHIYFRSASIRVLTKREELPALDYIAGGALFTRAAQYKLLGLLPEKYFLYWEEADWCYEAKKKGHPMLVCDEAICFDKIGTSVGRGFTAFFFYTRNGLLFVQKFKKKYLPLVLSLTAAKMLKAIISGHRERARGIYDGTMAFMKMTPK